jgi:hypothetical protein
MGCRQGVGEGASPNGAVTEPQRSRQPIFNATLRAVALWRFSGVARLAEITTDIGTALAPWRIANRRQQMTAYFGGSTLARADLLDLEEIGADRGGGGHSAHDQYLIAHGSKTASTDRGFRLLHQPLKVAG